MRVNGKSDSPYAQKHCTLHQTFGVNVTLISNSNNSSLTFSPVINIKKTFQLAIVVVILRIMRTEKNFASKAVERLHQTQLQFGCYKMWCKVTLVFDSVAPS